MLVGENTNTNEAKCKVSSYVLDDTNGNEKIIFGGIEKTPTGKTQKFLLRKKANQK